MTTLKYSEIRDRDQWNSSISTCVEADVYHTYDYTRACCLEEGSDSFFLIKVESECGKLLLPVISRKIKGHSKYFDLGSSYGYPGPVLVGQWDTVRLTDVFHLLSVELSKRDHVSLVTRCNPYSESQTLFSEVGELRKIADVVTIGLDMSSEERIAGYRKQLRYDIKKLKNGGLHCRKLDKYKHLDAFVELYYKQMDALEADRKYYFSQEYFNQLADSDQFDFEIHGCFDGDELLCLGCFLIGKNYIHYHLGATSERHTARAPTKLMLDYICDYGKTKNLKAVNLGGGLSGNSDPLYRFKSGFSKETRPFRVFLSIFDKNAYGKLCSSHMEMAIKSGKKIDPNYAPQYRAPLTKVAEPAITSSVTTES